MIFARIEGRGNTGGNPSCLDPRKDRGDIAFHPEEKAGMLGCSFVNKLAVTQMGGKIPTAELRKTVGRLTPGGKSSWNQPYTPGKYS